MFFRRKKALRTHSSGTDEVSSLPGDVPGEEPLDEIEKARRDIMLACLESARQEQAQEKVASTEPSDDRPVRPGIDQERQALLDKPAPAKVVPKSEGRAQVNVRQEFMNKGLEQENVTAKIVESPGGNVKQEIKKAPPALPVETAAKNKSPVTLAEQIRAAGQAEQNNKNAPQTTPTNSRGPGLPKPAPTAGSPSPPAGVTEQQQKISAPVTRAEVSNPLLDVMMTGIVSDDIARFRKQLAAKNR
ncbi:MAG: hypothetical protein JW860_01805 [Sedimentisphaerales bacterium]|nr:hypothetical protein [Sedimentisphaerales bacterium]